MCTKPTTNNEKKMSKDHQSYGFTESLLRRRSHPYQERDTDYAKIRDLAVTLKNKAGDTTIEDEAMRLLDPVIERKSLHFAKQHSGRTYSPHMDVNACRSEIAQRMLLAFRDLDPSKANTPEKVKKYFDSCAQKGIIDLYRRSTSLKHPVCTKGIRDIPDSHSEKKSTQDALTPEEWYVAIQEIATMANSVLNKTQSEVWKAFLCRPDFSRKELAAATGVSESSAKAVLIEMRKKARGSGFADEIKLKLGEPDYQNTGRE